MKKIKCYSFYMLTMLSITLDCFFNSFTGVYHTDMSCHNGDFTVRTATRNEAIYLAAGFHKFHNVMGLQIVGNVDNDLGR